jgi:hypothetical protein
VTSALHSTPVHAQVTSPFTANNQPSSDGFSDWEIVEAILDHAFRWLSFLLLYSFSFCPLLQPYLVHHQMGNTGQKPKHAPLCMKGATTQLLNVTSSN